MPAATIHRSRIRLRATRSARYIIRRAGFALVLTLFAVTLIAGLAFAVVSLGTLNTRAAHLEADAAQSYYNARVGIAAAEQWIVANEYPPADNLSATPVAMASPDQVIYTTTQAAPAGGKFSLTLTQGPARSLFEQWWQVDVTGQYGLGARTLRGFLRQESFAKFAYFSQQEMPGDYWITGNSFKGPAHTNGHFNFYGNPAFTDRTTTGNSDEAVNGPAVAGSPFDSRDMKYDTSKITGQDAGGSQVFTNTSQFYHAYAGSYANTFPVPYVDPTTNVKSPSFSFAGGQPVINLPASTQAVATHANLSFNGSKGDLVVTFLASGQVNIRQGTTYNQTLSTTGSPPPVINIDNGNMYVSGTVSGQCTICAGGYSKTTDPRYTSSPDGAGGYYGPYDYRSYEHDANPTPSVGQTDPNQGLGTGNVYVTGDLTYKSSAPTSTDVLGVVAQNNINVTAPDNHVTNNPKGGTIKGVTVDASLMTLKGIYMANHWYGGAVKGQMYQLGGLIAQTQTLFGMFDPGTGNIVYGYNENYAYDYRLASNPPPAFPTTGNIVIEGVADLGALK